MDLEYFFKYSVGSKMGDTSSVGSVVCVGGLGGLVLVVVVVEEGEEELEEGTVEMVRLENEGSDDRGILLTLEWVLGLSFDVCLDDIIIGARRVNNEVFIIVRFIFCFVLFCSTLVQQRRFVTDSLNE